MKTVQECLKSLNNDQKNAVAAKMCFEENKNGIRFILTENKDITIKQYLDTKRKAARAFIDTLAGIEAKPGDGSAFFAVRVFRDGFPEEDVSLATAEDIRTGSLEYVRTWALMNRADLASCLVADTKLTQQHIITVLAKILWGAGILGFDQASVDRIIEKIRALPENLPDEDKDNIDDMRVICEVDGSDVDSREWELLGDAEKASTAFAEYVRQREFQRLCESLKKKK